MLSFMLRKRIDAVMENAYRNNKWIYKEAFGAILADYRNGRKVDDEFAQRNNEASQRYIEAVRDSLSAFVDNAGQNVFARYQVAKMFPTTAGVPDGTPLCAGFLYCQLCYAFTGAPGKPKDAVKHNHLMHSYIDTILSELDDAESARN